MISIMVGSVTEHLAPDRDFLINGTNATGEVDVAARDAYRVNVAATTSVLGGILQVRPTPLGIQCLPSSDEPGAYTKKCRVTMGNLEPPDCAVRGSQSMQRELRAHRGGASIHLHKEEPYITLAIPITN